MNNFVVFCCSISDYWRLDCGTMEPSNLDELLNLDDYLQLFEHELNEGKDSSIEIILMKSIAFKSVLFNQYSPFDQPKKTFHLKILLLEKKLW